MFKGDFQMDLLLVIQHLEHHLPVQIHFFIRLGLF